MQGEIVLAENTSALGLMLDALKRAAAAYPQALGAVGVPDDRAALRKNYAALLPRFEAARLASADPLAIAEHMLGTLDDGLHWLDDDGRTSIAEHLSKPARPLALRGHDFSGGDGWRPGMVYRGTRYEGERLTDLGVELVTRGIVTPAAGDALRWLVDNVLSDGGINLRGRRIAMLGAGAEMAPTRAWLRAGADVLWIDTQPPPEDWFSRSDLAGRLWWPESQTNLLTQPRELLATLIEFAAGQPIDVGLYAYAPGQARELRLTASMNALVESLPPELVASVTMLVSPTTPTALSEVDLEATARRLDSRPSWEAWLDRLGLLGKGGGCTTWADKATTRTVVSIQGASYQLAQYFCKLLIAQRWSAAGGRQQGSSSALLVSANTAAITRTRSLAHPVFAAAFGGAGRVWCGNAGAAAVAATERSVGRSRLVGRSRTRAGCSSRARRLTYAAVSLGVQL